MTELTHGFIIDQNKCAGCLSCMRICPTHAIRVKNGKAHYQPEQCIDCGSCLKVCSSNAITATTWSIAEINKFKHRVAVPSPVLFGQFPSGITPNHIIEGLLALGFDKVWDYSVDVSLVSQAIDDYINKWKGPYPLISVSCPVVVRLVQVAYPELVDQLIHVQPPREIAAREVKHRYSEKLDISPDEIAVFYITPCQAKIISVLQPVEGVQSALSGCLAISDVFNAILTEANLHKSEKKPHFRENIIRNSTFLRWSLSEGLGRSLSQHHRYLSVTGLSNIIQVFDDIEKGKLQNVDFLEAHCCWTGCAGGNLTVANVYVTLSKLHTLVAELPEMDTKTQAEVKRRYPNEDLLFKKPIRPRFLKGISGDLKERVRIMKKAEAIFNQLPGFNCGLCGAPTCKVLAQDISIGSAMKTECVFFSKDHLRKLQSWRKKTIDLSPKDRAPQ